MIELRDIEFAYPGGEFRLAIPAFSIAKAEKVAVIGSSGSGKTTLLNLIAGINTPQRGSVNIDELAESMGIADKLKRHANDLSQGEKQRAAICRALLPNPRLILADEATGNLDPVNKTRILDLLFDSVDAHDATLLAVTHDHELLARFDRVIDFQVFRQDTAA